MSLLKPSRGSPVMVHTIFPHFSDDSTQRYNGLQQVAIWGGNHVPVLRARTLHYKIHVLWDKNMQIQSTLNKLLQSFHVHLHQKAGENLEKWCHPLWQNRPGVQAEPVASYSNCCQWKNHDTSTVLEFYGSFYRTCIILRHINLASERFVSN